MSASKAKFITSVAASQCGVMLLPSRSRFWHVHYYGCLLFVALAASCPRWQYSWCGQDRVCRHSAPCAIECRSERMSRQAYIFILVRAAIYSSYFMLPEGGLQEPCMQLAGASSSRFPQLILGSGRLTYPAVHSGGFGACWRGSVHYGVGVTMLWYVQSTYSIDRCAADGRWVPG
jgi:hypothetical protein